MRALPSPTTSGEKKSLRWTHCHSFTALQTLSLCAPDLFQSHRFIFPNMAAEERRSEEAWLDSREDRGGREQKRWGGGGLWSSAHILLTGVNRSSRTDPSASQFRTLWWMKYIYYCRYYCKRHRSSCRDRSA